MKPRHSWWFLVPIALLFVAAVGTEFSNFPLTSSIATNDLFLVSRTTSVPKTRTANAMQVRFATTMSTAITLTDAATISTDASVGDYFRVTLGGNRTLANPTNPTDRQRAVWEIIQDATGNRTLTMDTKFAFGTDITAITLTTNGTKRDFITAIYNATADKFYVVGFVRGY